MIDKLNKLFANCQWEKVVCNNTTYIVTNGTGEGGAFAHDIQDVERLLDGYDDDLNDSYGHHLTYEDWCSVIDPVTTLGVARVVRAELDWTLIEPGLCSPVSAAEGVKICAHCVENEATVSWEKYMLCGGCRFIIARTGELPSGPVTPPSPDRRSYGGGGYLPNADEQYIWGRNAIKPKC